MKLKMGRKAKLKQLKKQENQVNLETKKKELDNHEFVKEMEHKGYKFKQIKHSPEVPVKRIEPQI